MKRELKENNGLQEFLFKCSSWNAVFLTITVAVVIVNLISIIIFVKDGYLRTRSMYLVINLTVADMFVGQERMS